MPRDATRRGAGAWRSQACARRAEGRAPGFRCTGPTSHDDSCIPTASEAARAAAAAIAAQLSAQACVGAGASNRTDIARRVRRARAAARVGRRGLFPCAHVQSRRVRRAAVERQAQLLRVHAEAPLRANQPSGQPHPLPERRRARSPRGVHEIRTRNRRAWEGSISCFSASARTRTSDSTSRLAHCAPAATRRSSRLPRAVRMHRSSAAGSIEFRARP